MDSKLYPKSNIGYFFFAATCIKNLHFDRRLGGELRGGQGEAPGQRRGLGSGLGEGFGQSLGQGDDILFAGDRLSPRLRNPVIAIVQSG